VAYSVHDLEDGLHAGLITMAALRDPAGREAVAKLTVTEYCEPGSVTVAELDEVFSQLLGLDCWPAGFDGGPQSLAALKNLTSELIGRFCQAAERATLSGASRRAAAGAPAGAGTSDRAGTSARPGTPAGAGTSDRAGTSARPGTSARAAPGRLTRYGADLVVPRTQRLECALLKGVTAFYVMSRAGAAAAQAAERELVAELAAAVERGAPATLDPVLRPAWQLGDSDQARRRVVVDQIASLTDTSAIAWHRRLCR